jgi:uncharacterized membrane protein (UPF0182 family)
MTTNFPSFNFKPRRRGPLPIVIGVLVVASIALISLSGFYADWLWFKSVNFTEVWSTILITKATVFVIAGLATSLVITSNIYIAFRQRPLYVPLSVEADNLERYRAQIEPIRRLVLV